ncbi:hypothetical protein RUND412_002341 [Rhizina undulata]
MARAFRAGGEGKAVNVGNEGFKTGLTAATVILPRLGKLGPRGRWNSARSPNSQTGFVGTRRCWRGMEDFTGGNLQLEGRAEALSTRARWLQRQVYLQYLLLVLLGLALVDVGEILETILMGDKRVTSAATFLNGGVNATKLTKDGTLQREEQILGTGESGNQNQ